MISTITAIVLVACTIIYFSLQTNAIARYNTNPISIYISTATTTHTSSNTKIAGAITNYSTSAQQQAGYRNVGTFSTYFIQATALQDTDGLHHAAILRFYDGKGGGVGKGYDIVSTSAPITGAQLTSLNTLLGSRDNSYRRYVDSFTIPLAFPNITFIIAEQKPHNNIGIFTNGTVQVASTDPNDVSQTDTCTGDHIFRQACSIMVKENSTVTLTAQPTVGENTFTGWQDFRHGSNPVVCTGTSATCTITADSAKKVALAEFTPLVKHTLTLTANEITYIDYYRYSGDTQQTAFCQKTQSPCTYEVGDDTTVVVREHAPAEPGETVASTRGCLLYTSPSPRD